MQGRVFILFIVLAASHLLPAAADAVDINLSAAASLKNALGEMIADYTRTHPAVTVLPNFGASGTLAKQVVQGAPADLFISADDQWIDFLVSEGKGTADSKKTLATNRLVFAGRLGTAASLADLARLQRIAIGTPASVPAGRYAEQAMRHGGVYEELAGAKKLVMAQDVRQALLYADRGEVDGAFVYATDALLAERAKVLFEVPEDLHDRIAYPMIMTREGSSRPEARDFLTYLTGPEAAAILLKYGFSPAR